MRGERGLTTTETVIALVLCAALFVAGLGIGGAFDSESSKPAAATTAPPLESPSGAWTGEPTAEDLAALSAAAASAEDRAAEREVAAARKGASGGAAATAKLLPSGRRGAKRRRSAAPTGRQSAPRSTACTGWRRGSNWCGPRRRPSANRG